MAACALSASAAPVALQDDAGRSVVLPATAQRIVTLAPFLTELAFSAGAGARVVGRSAFSDYPPEAARLPEVATAVGPSIEAIAALHPDLALAWRDSIRDEDVQRLEAIGVRVFVARARGLDDPPRLLEAIARAVGGDAGAGVAYRARIAALRASHAGLAPISVLLEIWHQPLTTLAGPHWINEALAACGARNAFADLPGVAPAVPWELVHAREPSVIVGAGSAPTAAAFEAQWRERPAIKAVAAGRMVFVEGDLLQRPTLRLALGVARLCEGLDAQRARTEDPP